MRKTLTWRDTGPEGKDRERRRYGDGAWYFGLPISDCGLTQTEGLEVRRSELEKKLMKAIVGDEVTLIGFNELEGLLKQNKGGRI